MLALVWIWYYSRMIEAMIFDMDGLLINSEPVWREVEIDLFEELGISLTDEQAAETMGRRADEVVGYWYERYPWEAPDPAEVSEELINRMVGEVAVRDIALPGVREAFDTAEAAGLPTAIASSSPARLIRAAIGPLGIEHRLQVIQSAEHEPLGKPHPGVYLKTAERLGIAPARCLALEDSVNGVRAAKAAGMLCFAIPEEIMRGHPDYSVADKVLGSLTEFNGATLVELSS